MRLAAALAILVLPSVASAGPITAGITAGELQSKVDASNDANKTLGLFGRARMSPRLSGQLEIQRVQTDNDSTSIRSMTGLLVVDLGSSQHLVPTLLVGIGFDWSTSYDYTTSATHIEGGFGLEYRTDTGITVGADLRMGGRTGGDQSIATPGGPVLDRYVPSTLHEGEYRSARLTVGIHF